MTKHNSIQYLTDQNNTESWLALVIGNTRLHWGYFYQDSLLETWHTPHLNQDDFSQLQQADFRADAWKSLKNESSEFSTVEHITSPERSVLSAEIASPSEIWIASAVPEQMSLWRSLNIKLNTNSSLYAPAVFEVERSYIPLDRIYPTLGIDRAINLLGAGQLSGWPTLVIDSGTALTFTAGIEKNGKPSIYGGAILPGLRLQYESLAQKTAVLGAHMPAEEAPTLPKRWAMDTKGAIASGLTFSLTATLTDYLNSWWQQFPQGNAIITGGDAPLLHHYLTQRTPEIASRVLVKSELMFYGMQAYRQALFTNRHPLCPTSVGPTTES